MINLKKITQMILPVAVVILAVAVWALWKTELLQNYINLNVAQVAQTTSKGVAIEAEGGALSGAVSVGSDVNASGGSFVQFNSSMSFVNASGSALQLNGEPYKFVGINRYNLLT